MKFPIHFDDLYKLVLTLFPNAEISEEGDGELTVHTRVHMISSDGFCGPMPELSEESK